MNVSVIVPLFNREDYVAEALESALSQRHKPFEVIVVDDGSTDRSIEVAGAYPVKLHRMEKNQGLSVARNMAMSLATGDVLAFLDSDDRWLPDHLSTISELFRVSPEIGIAYARTRAFGAAEREWRHTLEPWKAHFGYWDLVDSMIVPIPAAAIRRRVLDSLGGFDERFRIAEDYEFFLRASRHEQMACSDEVTVEYRVHANQLSGDPVRLLRGTWEARMSERTRLAHEYNEPFLKRFDQIACGVARRDGWELVHLGAVELIRSLRREFVQLGSQQLASGFPRWFEWGAEARRLATRLPAPVRTAGRSLARRLPR